MKPYAEFQEYPKLNDSLAFVRIPSDVGSYPARMAHSLLPIVQDKIEPGSPGMFRFPTLDRMQYEWPIVYFQLYIQFLRILGLVVFCGALCTSARVRLEPTAERK